MDSVGRCVPDCFPVLFFCRSESLSGREHVSIGFNALNENRGRPQKDVKWENVLLQFAVFRLRLEVFREGLVTSASLSMPVLR